MIKKIIKSCNFVFTQLPYYKILQNPSQENEDDFFSRIRVENETYKKTGNQRLADIDAIINPILFQEYGNKEKIKIMDVGVSSGVTSVNWYDKLKKYKMPFELIAGDAFINAFRGRIIKDKFEVLLNPSGKILEYNIGNLVFKSWMLCPLSILTSPFAELARLFFIPYTKLFQKGRTFSFLEPIKLISSRFNEEDDLKFIKDDVINDKHHQNSIHCLRACNIINVSYFDQPTLRKIIANLLERIVEGGYFIVVRSEKSGGHNGDVFKITQKKIHIIYTIGRGSEVRDLILESKRHTT